MARADCEKILRQNVRQVLPGLRALVVGGGVVSVSFIQRAKMQAVSGVMPVNPG